MKVIWEKERLNSVYSRMIHLASATSYGYFLRVITYAQFNSIRCSNFIHGSINNMCTCIKGLCGLHADDNLVDGFVYLTLLPVAIM
jgi:hypothetical protein